MAANATRPDPIQISYVFQEQAKKEGKDYSLHVDDFIEEFQGLHTMDHKKLSPVELAIVKLWPKLDEATQIMIADHWHTYPNQKSGLPMQDLANPVLQRGCKPRPAQDSVLFRDILACTQEKVHLCVARRIGIFLFKLADPSF